MKKWMAALACCGMLAGMTGCIPIGVRGSTYAVAQPSSNAASQVEL